jgi:hypothetical protein
MTPDDRDRRSPAFDKPSNYSEMVEAARNAAQAARAAGADYTAVKKSAEYAALQIAGLRPLEDLWAKRVEREP